MWKSVPSIVPMTNNNLLYPYLKYSLDLEQFNLQHAHWNASGVNGHPPYGSADSDKIESKSNVLRDNKPLGGWEITHAVLWSFFTILHDAMFALAESHAGVPSMTILLLCVIVAISQISVGRLKSGRKKRWVLLFVVWLFVASLDQRQRRRLVSRTQAEVYRRLALDQSQGSETLNWANQLVDAMWRGSDDGSGLGSYISQDIAATVVNSLSKTAPSSIAQLKLLEFSLGSVAPIVQSIQSIVSEEAPLLVMEEEMQHPSSYRQRKAVHFRANVQMASRDLSLVCAIKMTSLERAMLPSGVIRLSELFISGTMLITVEILPEYPFVGVVVWVFESIPEVDIHFSGAGLDVVSLGAVDNWVRIAIREALRAYSMPYHANYDLGWRLTSGGCSPCSSAAEEAPPLGNNCKDSNTSTTTLGSCPATRIPTPRVDVEITEMELINHHTSCRTGNNTGVQQYQHVHVPIPQLHGTYPPLSNEDEDDKVLMQVLNLVP